MKTKPKILLILSLLLPSLSFAQEALKKVNSPERKKVPTCESENFSKYSSLGYQITIRELPKSILIGRSASLYLEDVHLTKLKLKATQSFTNPKSEINCATSNIKDNFQINMTAPVLLDLSSQPTIGNSVWQFNIMARGHQVGLWNQVSQILSKDFKFEEWVNSSKHQISFYQISDDQYELVIRSTEKSEEKILVISFDAVRTLE